jgi:hypothetical protein
MLAIPILNFQFSHERREMLLTWLASLESLKLSSQYHEYHYHGENESINISECAIVVTLSHSLIYHIFFSVETIKDKWFIGAMIKMRNETYLGHLKQRENLVLLISEGEIKVSYKFLHTNQLLVLRHFLSHIYTQEYFLLDFFHFIPSFAVMHNPINNRMSLIN